MPLYNENYTKESILFLYDRIVKKLSRRWSDEKSQILGMGNSHMFFNDNLHRL